MRVLAFSTEDDTGTVLYSAVPILAECHYSNIRDSSVCIGMTIRVLSFILPCPYWQNAITQTSVTPVSVLLYWYDDTGTGLFD